MPPRDRPAADRRLQLVLPRLGRRVVRDARRAGPRPRARGARGPGRSTPPRPRGSRSSTTSTRSERVLEHGDVACLLMEPALTNIGIVLPGAGLHGRRARALHEHGTLLIIDETHTLSAGPGGCTAAWGLEPDAVTLGKSIGGGVPIGAYGVTRRAGRADRGAGGRRLRGHRRGGRHARRQRALARGGARHARRGAHRRGVRAHDRAARALRGGSRGRDRRARHAVVDRLARRALRVPLHARAAAHRRRVGRRRTTRSSRSTFICT